MNFYIQEDNHLEDKLNCRMQYKQCFQVDSLEKKDMEDTGLHLDRYKTWRNLLKKKLQIFNNLTQSHMTEADKRFHIDQNTGTILVCNLLEFPHILNFIKSYFFNKNV